MNYNAIDSESHICGYAVTYMNLPVTSIQGIHPRAMNVLKQKYQTVGDLLANIDKVHMLKDVGAETQRNLREYFQTQDAKKIVDIPKRPDEAKNYPEQQMNLPLWDS